MKWFGEHWGAPVCDLGEHVPTPVGTPCVWCAEDIADGDQGFVIPGVASDGATVDAHFHMECQLRSIFGSVGHQMGLCCCPGGTGQMEDPPDMTIRQAARAAYEYFVLNSSSPQHGKISMN